MDIKTDKIIFVKQKVKYYQSFWETINTIALEGIYLATDKRFGYESTVQFLNKCKESNSPQLLVIDKRTDRCVGWCDILYKTDKIGTLGVGLLADYREKGIGRQLIFQTMKMAKQYGYTKIELDVRKSNERAIHVYEAIGFKTFNTITGGYVTKKTVIKEDVMQMEIELK